MPPYSFIPDQRKDGESSSDTFAYPHKFVVYEINESDNFVEQGVASGHRTFSKILKKADPKSRKKGRRS